MTLPLKVNFSKEEATSKPRDLPPTGEYVVNIVDGSLETVKHNADGTPKANTGKNFWKLRFVIQEGPYSGSTLIGTVMLFDGALYSLAQLLTALSIEVPVGGFQISPTLLQSIMGKTIKIKGYLRPAKTDEHGKDVPERFEIKSYKPYAGNAKSGDSALLP